MTIIIAGAIIYLIIQGIKIDRKIDRLEKNLQDWIEYTQKEQRYKDFIASKVKNKF